jgi:hypothetical protein
MFPNIQPNIMDNHAMGPNPIQYQQPHSPFAQGISSGVELSVFTPRNHGSIYLRPLAFNFNDQTISEMMCNGSASQALSSFVGPGKDAIRTAIMPTGQGIQVNTDTYDTMWSFILVFDSTGNRMTTTRYGAPRRRTVLTGYFLDEPINPITMFSSNPVFNPDALLLFTHNSSMSIQECFGARQQRNFSVTSNADIIPQMTAQTVNEDLALVDSATIAKCSMPGSVLGERVISDAGAFVSTFDERSGISHASSRSPRHQMMAIANAIDGAGNHVQDTDAVFGSMGDGQMHSDPFDKFVNELHQNVATQGQMPIINNVDPTIPMSLGHLDALFPDMTMKPYKIPINPEYAVREQGSVNVHNVMASMVQNTVPVFAAECMLASVSFRHASWVQGDLCGLNKGQWEIISATSMVGDDLDPQKLINALGNFKRTMENTLFPVLLTSGGEFDLTVAYDMSSSTIIDLQYMDWDETGIGMYEGHNRLGGMVSPALGGVDTLNSNRIQFDQLVNTVASVGSNPNGHPSMQTL